jgi:hypothetical protein
MEVLNYGRYLVSGTIENKTDPCQPTQLVEHVDDVLPIYDAVTVAIEDLKGLPHGADLRGLQLGERISVAHRARSRNRRPGDAALLGK